MIQNHNIFDYCDIIFLYIIPLSEVISTLYIPLTNKLKFIIKSKDKKIFIIGIGK